MSTKSARRQWLAAFGEVLANLWLQKQERQPKLSLRGFARHVKVSHSMLIKWNRGQVHSPEAQAVQRLEVAYGIVPGRLAEIVRQNQANPNLAFDDALAILNGEDTTASPAPPLHPAGVEPQFIDRRTARKLVKQAQSLATFVGLVLGESATNPGTQKAQHRPHSRPRLRKRDRQIAKRA